MSIVPTVFVGSESLTKLKGKKSSAQHVEEHRERERQKPGYDHEKLKEETCLRVAAIHARRPKRSLGRKCKNSWNAMKEFRKMQGFRVQT